MTVNKILIGTNEGAFEIQKNEDNSWSIKTKHLDGNWISSINKTQERTLITTKKGAFFELDNSSKMNILYSKEFDFRLWFSFSDYKGLDSIGGVGGRVLSRDDNEKWAATGNLSTLAKDIKWESHSGGEVHLHSILFKPSTPRRLYCGAEVGGVAYSADNGKNWVDITFNLEPDVHGMALDNNEQLTVSTGTGIFTLDQLKKEWSKIGSSDLDYCQGIVYRQTTDTFIISSSRDSFGRVSGGVYSGVREDNKFGVFEVAKNGTWEKINSGGLDRAGVLSKAICCKEDTVFLAAADGNVYKIDSENKCEIIIGGIPGIIECIELY